MRHGFLKIAAATPDIQVADCEYNAEQIISRMREARAEGAKILALSELTHVRICFCSALCWMERSRRRRK